MVGGNKAKAEMSSPPRQKRNGKARTAAGDSNGGNRAISGSSSSSSSSGGGGGGSNGHDSVQPPASWQSDKSLPYKRGAKIKQSKLEDRHPHISMPVDFEHFLHVGAQNLSDVNVLCRDQQKAFEEIVEKRSRRLPKPPQTVTSRSPWRGRGSTLLSPIAGVSSKQARSTSVRWRVLR